MKMIMAIIQRGQAEKVMQAIIEAGFAFTFMESRGGMLRQSQLTLFIAVQEKDVKNVIAIIRSLSQMEVAIETASRQTMRNTPPVSAKAHIGNGVFFIWELEGIGNWLSEEKDASESG